MSKWTLQDLCATASVWLKQASSNNGLDVADVVSQLAADLTTVEKVQEVIHGRIELARSMPNLPSVNSETAGQPKERVRDSHRNPMQSGTLDAMGQGVAFFEGVTERTDDGKTIIGLDLVSIAVAASGIKETGE